MFVLALEPLACTICEHVNITGIRIGGQDKLSMDADDILLTLSNPALSIPKGTNQLVLPVLRLSN